MDYQDYLRNMKRTAILRSKSSSISCRVKLLPGSLLALDYEKFSKDVRLDRGCINY